MFVAIRRLPLKKVPGVRPLSKLVPPKPTWDLMPSKSGPKEKQKIDFKKLEKLSLLSIDKKMEADLETVIDVAERMCSLKLSEDDDVKPLIHFNYLGKCQLREDDAKIASRAITGSDDASLRAAQNWRDSLMRNAKYKYDDYFIGPPVIQSKQ